MRYTVNVELEDVSGFVDDDPWTEQIVVVAESEDDARIAAVSEAHERHPGEELFVISGRVSEHASA